MQFKLISQTPRVLLAAGLVFGVATAQAASGYTVSHSQESLVTAGMNTAEVELALGSPTRNVKYRNEPGPTWSYEMVDSHDTWFDVDFGPDGNVASVSERVEETH